MSLTSQDLNQIRIVVLEALDVAVNPRLDSLENRMDGLEGRMDSLENRMDGLEGRMDSLEGRMTAQENAQRETNRRLDNLERTAKEILGKLEALENDVKELYLMVDRRTKIDLETKKFSNLSGEKKLVALYEAVTNLAKEMGVNLHKPKIHRT